MAGAANSHARAGPLCLCPEKVFEPVLIQRFSDGVN